MTTDTHNRISTGASLLSLLVIVAIWLTGAATPHTVAGEIRGLKTRIEALTATVERYARENRAQHDALPGKFLTRHEWDEWDGRKVKK